jgi:hypothetical protein
MSFRAHSNVAANKMACFLSSVIGIFQERWELREVNIHSCLTRKKVIQRFPSRFTGRLIDAPHPSGQNRGCIREHSLGGPRCSVSLVEHRGIKLGSCDLTRWRVRFPRTPLTGSLIPSGFLTVKKTSKKAVEVLRKQRKTANGSPS